MQLFHCLRSWLILVYVIGTRTHTPTPVHVMKVAGCVNTRDRWETAALRPVSFSVYSSVYLSCNHECFEIRICHFTGRKCMRMYLYLLVSRVIYSIVFSIMSAVFVKLSVIFIMSAVHEVAGYRVNAKKWGATWKTFEHVGSAMWLNENTKCFPFGMLDDEIVWFCVLNRQLTVFGHFRSVGYWPLTLLGRNAVCF